MPYDLEIVAMAERVDRRLALLQQSWPTLRFSTKSRMFVIFWGTLQAELTETSKALLQSYIEDKTIVCWRCKRQKDA